MQVFAKKTCSWTAKNYMITKIDRICRKSAISSSADPRHLVYSHLHIICNIYSACICVYNAIFGGYRPVYNQYASIVGYRGKIPDGHSNPIYLVLKPLKLQNSWRIFDRPVSSMYCKYAEHACKLQTFFPWTINNVLIWGKHVISYYK